MKITIYAKQMTVRESLKAMIEKKLAKFDKFFGDDTEAFVTCRVRKSAKILEITINYNGITFRSEAESETFMTALDRAAESLERQIRRNKTRVEKSKRLLRDTELPIVEIANLTGFEDQSYFTKQFKAETGLSPKEFRENN